jgi:hypothetical protein
VIAVTGQSVDLVLTAAADIARRRGRSPLLIDALSAIVAINCKIFPFCAPVAMERLIH